MIPASIQIILALLNTILIIRYSENIVESDFYILLNSLAGFISAIVFSYINVKWFAQLSKAVDSQRKYSRYIKLFRLEVIITSGAGCALGILGFLTIIKFNDNYSQELFLISLTSLIIILIASILINSYVIEERATKNINKAEYPGAFTQLTLLILLIIFHPSTAPEVLLLSAFSHASSLFVYLRGIQTFKRTVVVNIIKKNMINNSPKYFKISLSASLFKSSPLIDRLLASQLNDGDVTSLGIASTISTGIALAYEKSFGIKHVINIIDCLKHSKKPSIILRLLILIGLTSLILLCLILIESNTGILTFALIQIFGLNKDVASNCYFILILLIIALPFQLVGPAVSALYQYYRLEHLPMYLGALGFAMSAIAKFFLFNNFGILIIPAISLLTVISLFSINYLQSRKLNAKTTY